MTDSKLKEENYSIIENFISALNIEFEESKKNNVEKQISSKRINCASICDVYPPKN